MIRACANNLGRSLLIVLAVSASALAACEPETVDAPASSSSPARTDAGAARASTQMPAETASPTASGMSEGMQPPARAPSMNKAGAAGGDEAKKAEPKEKASMAGAGGTSSPNNKGGAGGATMASMKKPACAQLASCCGGLKDNRDRDNCEELVQRDDADRCERASGELCSANAGGMGGTGPMTTAGMGAPAGSCMQLSMCCSTLDRLQQRACMEAVDEARADACSTLLERRCPELGPVPQEPACATLHACCAKLTEPRALEQCRRALEDGDRRDCERASMLLCQ